MAEEEISDVDTSEILLDATDDFAPPAKSPHHRQQTTDLDRDSIHAAAHSAAEIRRRRFRSSTETSSAPQATITSDPHPSSLEFLLLVARVLTKALEFEIRILVALIASPLRLLRSCFALAADPFGAIRRLLDGIGDRIAGMGGGMFDSELAEWAWRRKPEAIRLAWGCFWSLYVGFVLVGCLLTAFFVGWVVMWYAVEEPVRITRDLRFDYTTDSPVATVHLPPPSGVGGPVRCGDMGGLGDNMKLRFIPPNRKLRLSVFLTLPESNYNRNLGVFQVKSQFLTMNGKVSVSSSLPCMLKYKSSAIRYLEAALKFVPILAGYSSESQVVQLKMDDLIEDIDPTVCIRVFIEKRAEYKPGYGIPEIYAASIELETDLPFLKKIIWNWRKTIFIWIATSLLGFELLIFVVFCRPFVIP